jgi:hypothetical protein
MQWMEEEIEAYRRACVEWDKHVRSKGMSDEKEVKPGYKTTEFWLSTVAVLIGLAYGSGIISDGSQADKIVGFIAAALSSLGYSVSRGLAKK